MASERTYHSYRTIALHICILTAVMNHIQRNETRNRAIPIEHQLLTGILGDSCKIGGFRCLVQPLLKGNLISYHQYCVTLLLCKVAIKLKSFRYNMKSTNNAEILYLFQYEEASTTEAERQRCSSPPDRTDIRP